MRFLAIEEDSDSAVDDADADAVADFKSQLGNLGHRMRTLEVNSQTFDRELIRCEDRVKAIEEQAKLFDTDIDDLDDFKEQSIKKFSRNAKDHAYLESRMDILTMQIDFLHSALRHAGIVLPAPLPMDTTVLPAAQPASTSTPPILLTPSTPANTQEAEAYAPMPLLPPSLASIPPIDADQLAVAERPSAEVAGQPEMVGQAPLDREQPGPDAVGIGADLVTTAGPHHKAERADEAEEGEVAVTPAEHTQAGDIIAQEASIPPPAPPPCQSTLQPPAPPLPPLPSFGSRSHTPVPSPAGPQLSPLPGHTSRRSPRLQNPIVASPKGKRPRADDEGRGASKRRKE